ncbi:MAG TPA: hypothetical protein VF821_34900 [Lentzea sp.]
MLSKSSWSTWTPTATTAVAMASGALHRLVTVQGVRLGVRSGHEERRHGRDGVLEDRRVRRHTEHAALGQAVQCGAVRMASPLR